MSFSDSIIAWQLKHGRHNLPWQDPITPYRVWVSEIMLQQTQVETVKGYFQRFMDAFPTVSDLAQAPLDDINALWAGLGYYRRAYHLHETSKRVLADHHGMFPTDPDILVTLPGIGKSTAHAIASIAADAPYAILDANVKRVLARHFGMQEDVEKPAIKKELFARAQTLMPDTKCRVYTQGMMDLGATICTKTPSCQFCPVHDTCQAFAQKTQHLIPKKRVKKPKPTKEKRFLYLTSQSQLCLTKRPPDGIWPNLWTLPEFDTLDDLLAFLPEQVHTQLIPLPSRKHSFTHYHLILHPYYLSVDSWPANRRQTHTWIDLDNQPQYGMPAPIEKIVRSCIIDAKSFLELS